jgi:Inner centromere protein, ARK binding region
LSFALQNKLFHSNAPGPSVSKTFRPSPIVEVHPYRSTAASGASDEERRKAMNSKIRQKALESKGGAASARSQYVAQAVAPAGGYHLHKPALPMARPSPVTKVVPSNTTSAYSSPAATTAKKWNSASAKKKLASAVKKLSPIQPPPSPAYESYPMTDSEDELSDEDEYNEGQARKPVKRYPAWTHPQVLAAALQKQYSDPAMDPDLIFGDFSAQSCDLVAIFGDCKERYKRRGSSGNWTNDRLTEREKHEFSLQRHQPALTRPF